MDIGVSGHRIRDGADWSWTRDQIIDLFLDVPEARGWSQLAIGADQLLAEVSLLYGAGHVAVIPGHNYEKYFEGRDIDRYRLLLKRSQKSISVKMSPDEKAFRVAGERIVDAVDMMIFVWDGAPTGHAGGTAAIVDYARKRGANAIWLNPISRASGRL